MLNAIIKKNAINATPTCLIKYPSTGIKKYIGSDEIWNGLNKLKIDAAK